MTGFLHTLHKRILLTVTFCTLIFMICVAFRLNAVKSSKPYAWYKIRNSDKKELDSVAEDTQLKDTNFLKETTTLLADIYNASKNWEQNRIFVFSEKATVSDINISKNDTKSRTMSVISDSNNTEKNGVHFKIGILIPATTKNIRNRALETLSLTKICLPSIYKSMEIEYAYNIYVGIDKGDYLETVKHVLEKMFDRVKVIVTPGKTFTKSVNDIARTAYRDGMDYFVRINDDTSFETKNWTSAALKVLQNYTPPNIGVVGPTCHDGNTAILTHDMVHRTHLEIFDFYYPPYFDNWWADDWITKVYDIGRSTKLKSWVVKHHYKFHGRRYNPDTKKMSRLNVTVAFDCERLDEYISNLKH